MNYRRLGKTAMSVSEVSLGTWQVGGGWGSDFDESTADHILNTAVDQGINFFDTADVYDGGASERAVGALKRRRGESIHLATKCGRFINPHVSEGYTENALRGFVEASLNNTGLEQLDLIQLHCPPTEVYYRPEIFGLFATLKDEGKIAHFGVSVEKVEEALKAIEYPVVETVQIIFNMFRQRPAERFFPLAAQQDVGIICRVPLASGLLSGRMNKNTSFAEGDHRNFNRTGEAFDRGETFAGIPFEDGVRIVERIKKELPEHLPLAAAALRWILDSRYVSTVIPGASRPEQVSGNAVVSEAGPLSAELLQAVREIYEQEVTHLVHHRW